jgi:XTP/dITP diphosphohydrolase
VLALVRSAEDAAPLLSEGVWEGHIALQAAGSGGFGYDPLFIPLGHSQTVAQLPVALKRDSSHRAQATAALLSAVQAALAAGRMLAVPKA